MISARLSLHSLQNSDEAGFEDEEIHFDLAGELCSTVCPLVLCASTLSLSDWWKTLDNHGRFRRHLMPAPVEQRPGTETVCSWIVAMVLPGLIDESLAQMPTLHCRDFLDALELLVLHIFFS
jgi:hypothetical protein